ncbi:hypothetical protein [Streptomyces sp. NPDC051014]|uniref:hypothetical protein n=1 Tax=Streptomyces sp. NPDC051014 TaxID=3155751 RepID=UPI0033D29C72
MLLDAWLEQIPRFGHDKSLRRVHGAEAAKRTGSLFFATVTTIRLVANLAPDFDAELRMPLLGDSQDLAGAEPDTMRFRPCRCPPASRHTPAAGSRGSLHQAAATADSSEPPRFNCDHGRLWALEQRASGAQ